MYGRNVQIRFGGPLTPVVKNLLILNGVIFLLQQIFSRPDIGYAIVDIFGVSWPGVLTEYRVWQLGTYMFFHGGFLHILFNLLALWMFGGELEQLWGSRSFLIYYLASGIGAGVAIVAINYLSGNPSPTIGASGVVYALLLAYGMTWPNRQVLLFFVIPVRIKYLVIGMGLIEFLGTVSSLSGTGDGSISHIGHLGGLATGILLMLLKFRGTVNHAQPKRLTGDNVFKRLLKKLRMRRKQREINDRIRAKRIIDELLEKIARQGMQSLSSEEKKNLEWARKHYHPDVHDVLH